MKKNNYTYLKKNNISLEIPHCLEEFQEYFNSIVEKICKRDKVKNLLINLNFYLSDEDPRAAFHTVVSLNDKKQRHVHEINVNLFQIIEYDSCFFRIFLHEMRHLIQFETGQLKYSHRPKGLVWNNRLYKKSFITKRENYKILPWEIDAKKAERNASRIARNEEGIIAKVLLGNKDFFQFYDKFVPFNEKKK